MRCVLTETLPLRKHWVKGSRAIGFSPRARLLLIALLVFAAAIVEQHWIPAPLCPPDEKKLPVSMRMRRMPLCETPPWTGQPVIVAVPEGTARSRIMSPELLARDVQTRFPTVISDVATTGNSGSGVFDAGRKCLLGIMGRKIHGQVARRRCLKRAARSHEIFRASIRDPCLHPGQLSPFNELASAPKT
jgi:hypothetical protein